MKAKNPDEWTQMTTELRATEEGQRFLTFFEFWFDAADTMLAEIDPGELGGWRKHGFAESVRAALQTAEAEYGFLSVDLIGQMMSVASMYWAHGEEMVSELTFVEHRLLEESFGKSIAELQHAAAEAASDPKG